jgi:hypothetical protein
MAWTTKKGFNFRDTLAFDTDGANEVAIIGDGSNNIAATQVYPRSVTIDGDTFNVGWDTDSGDGARNRNAANDARLAGLHLVANSQVGGRTFRINLPAPGTYAITLALGDNDNGAANYWQVIDDASVLETNDLTGAALSSGQYHDANEAVHTSAANWVTNQTAKQYTFASSIFKLRTGKGSGAGLTELNHIGIQLINTSTIVNRETGRRGVGRGVLRGV